MPVLSDGLPIEVRQLGLYELDLVSGDMPDRQFYYEMGLLGGQTVKAPYSFPTIPPVSPDKPIEECQPNSREWYQWQNYQTYEAAIAHLYLWTVEFEKWQNKRDDYILLNCISEADRQRIKTTLDWQVIKAAAMLPELRMEDLERQASTVFQDAVGWFTTPEYLVRLCTGWFREFSRNPSVGSGNYRSFGLAGV